MDQPSAALVPISAGLSKPPDAATSISNTAFAAFKRDMAKVELRLAVLLQMIEGSGPRACYTGFLGTPVHLDLQRAHAVVRAHTGPLPGNLYPLHSQDQAPAEPLAGSQTVASPHQ